MGQQLGPKLKKRVKNARWKGTNRSSRRQLALDAMVRRSHTDPPKKVESPKFYPGW